MKYHLFLTTAACGLIGFPAGVLAEIISTETTTYTYDFPDSEPKIKKVVSVDKDCPRRDPPGHNRGECGCETCFDYHTPVLMADGCIKKIGEIIIGDETAYGRVNQTFIRRFDQSLMLTKNFQQAYLGGLYRYKGVLVTGNHMVRDGQQWLYVAHASGVVPVLDMSVENVYNLDVEGGIIPIMDEQGIVLAFLDDKQTYIAQRLSA